MIMWPARWIWRRQPVASLVWFIFAKEIVSALPAMVVLWMAAVLPRSWNNRYAASISVAFSFAYSTLCPEE